MFAKLKHAFVFALVSATAIASAEAQSLKQTLATAYRNSNLLDQNRALLRATDESAALALAALRPVIGFTASVSATEPAPPGGNTLAANASISARLTIYDGGDRDIGMQVAKENILSTRAALRSLEQQVLLQAAAAFFNLRRAGSLVALQENAIDLNARELEAARDRFDVGEATRTDVALAEARLAAAKSALAAAEGGYARAREAYRAAVGAYPRVLGDPGPLPRAAANLAAAKANARARLPSVIQAQHAARVADLNVKRAETAFGPSVNLSGALSTNDDINNTASLALTVDKTLYAGGQRSALHRQAIAQQEAARAALLQSAVLAEQGAGDAWADLSVANASLVATEDQIRAARLAFEGMREEASLGARTTLDVYDAEQDLLDAQTNRAGAINDRFIAAYALVAATGRMTAEHLNLGIVTYDPAAYYESIKHAPRRASPEGSNLDRILKALGRDGGEG